LEALGIWLLLTGIVGFFAMGVDKSRAIYGEWRISEKALFTMALGADSGAWSWPASSFTTSRRN